MPKSYSFSKVFSHLLSQRGVSIIITLTIVSFMIGFIADMMVSSKVAHQMSINLQDSARAHYLAKSGSRLGKFLLSIDAGIDLKLAELSQQPIEDSLADPWAMLNDLPIGGEELEQFESLVESFALSKIKDGDVIEKLKTLQGSFSLHISDEGSRVNLSYLQSSILGSKVVQILELLFSCPAEKRFIENQNLTPEELIFRIHDFIDTDKKNRSGSGLSSEVAPYSERSPPLTPPNHPLPSLHQLTLVEGWNAELHTVFAPFLTVFPIPNRYSKKSKRQLAREPSLNINTVSRELLQCLFPEMTDDCYKTFVRLYAEKEESKAAFSSHSTISDDLQSKLCYEKPARSTKDRSAWFTTTSSTFRIRAVGRSGDLQRVVEEVVYRLSPELMKSKQTSSSLDMLYWRSGSL